MSFGVLIVVLGGLVIVVGAGGGSRVRDLGASINSTSFVAEGGGVSGAGGRSAAASRANREGERPRS